MTELKTPADKAVISLHTPFQKEFIREGRRYLKGELDLVNFRNQALSDTSRPCKVVFTWDAKDALSSVIEISKNEDFSEIFISDTAINRYEAYNFENGTTYFWRVRNQREESMVFSFTTEDAAPRFIYCDGTTNVRDIGGFVTGDGYRIKQGLVFRGAELDMHLLLSDAGVKMMHDTLKIKTELDLRAEARDFTSESRIGKDVNYVLVHMGAYGDFISDENKKRLKALFDIMADEKNYPIYFHCWGGADRTGCVAFILEALLGLDEENLMKNFELTTLSGMGNLKNRDDEDFSFMVNELGKYGKTWKEIAENFLNECGISFEKIQKIRQIMLEKA